MDHQRSPCFFLLLPSTTQNGADLKRTSTDLGQPISQSRYSLLLWKMNPQVNGVCYCCQFRFNYMQNINMFNQGTIQQMSQRHCPYDKTLHFLLLIFLKIVLNVILHKALFYSKCFWNILFKMPK